MYQTTWTVTHWTATVEPNKCSKVFWFSITYDETFTRYLFINSSSKSFPVTVSSCSSLDNKYQIGKKIQSEQVRKRGEGMYCRRLTQEEIRRISDRKYYGRKGSRCSTFWFSRFLEIYQSVVYNFSNLQYERELHIWFFPSVVLVGHLVHGWGVQCSSTYHTSVLNDHQKVSGLSG